MYVTIVMSQTLIVKPTVHKVYQDSVSVGATIVLRVTANWFVDNSINNAVVAGNASKSARTPIDDTESRKYVWKTFFGSSKMPAQEQDAVKKYAGILGTDVEITNEDIENALKIAKEK